MKDEISREQEIQELRLHKGLEHVSDEEANHIIDTVNQFCNIAYECYLKKGTNETGYQEAA